MINRPMDILQLFPVRKTKDQKQAFRNAVQIYAERLGYPVTVESGQFGSRNLVIGVPEGASYLVSAHYDTCARLPIPNLIVFHPLLIVLYQCLFSCVMVLPSFLVGLGTMVVSIFYAFSSGFDTDSVTQIGTWSFLGVFIPLMVLTLFMLYCGPANKHNANDNTSGVVTLLEIARTMPENQRHKVCFVLFDLEEKGLLGSRDYRKAHKEQTDRQFILNLDCVGDGDHIMMFPTKKLKRDRKKLTTLYKACGYFGKKSIQIREKGFSAYGSDQKRFPCGVGICALRKGKLGLYLGRIHTHKDTILEETNVNILRAALTSFICCDAVNEERKMKNETV